MFKESTTKLLVPAVRNAMQKRAQSVVAGPAINKISTAEKIILGGGMTASWLVIPSWVLYHIREYRGDH